MKQAPALWSCLTIVMYLSAEVRINRNLPADMP